MNHQQKYLAPIIFYYYVSTSNFLYDKILISSELNILYSYYQATKCISKIRVTPRVKIGHSP